VHFLLFGKNACSHFLHPRRIWVTIGVVAVGVMRFSVRGFGCAPFYLLTGGHMSKNIPKNILDITGIELLPEDPYNCLGNGKRGFECCCDECDYYLLCFPSFDPQEK
jgi:hypothetical protein